MKSKSYINPITERIIKEAKKQNKSIYKICKHTGISESTMSSSKNYENAWMSAVQMKKIADFLNVSDHYLITGSKISLDENKIIEKLKSEIIILEDENEDYRIKIKALLTTVSELMSLDEKGRNKLYSSFLKSDKS